MIDPFHLYMHGRRPSIRQIAESKNNKSTSKSTEASTTASASVSKNSSVDSSSHQSSYISGDSLSPASTVSNDHAAKASLVASSASPASTSSLQHKLPEFEHFRQSSPLMPEFYPRTSDFFSQGRRRSSIAVTPETAAASAGLAAAVGAACPNSDASAPPSRIGAAGSNSAKKATTFQLPLTFEEPESLQGEQLPVRLGLAPPSHSHGLSASDATYKSRVGHGYYFFTPPPEPRHPLSSKPPLPPSLRRRDTETSQNSTLSLNTKLSSNTSIHSSPTSTSPSTAASSPQRTRASTSITSLPAPTLAGQPTSSNTSASSSRVRLPPTSPDCWHPEAYFTRIRSRVKGKMQEYVYHAFPSSAVPYWHGYGRESVEAEMSTHLNVNAVLHGNTLREFPEHSRPCRVLDLGCGRGMWCLDMARQWKSSEFVGLDVVPIQPPMHHLADPDLEHRVSWVVANFLEPLPFPDASFDFVHIRFVVHAVPEDRWVDLFSEARRVLAPGGVLEVSEANYSFFGHASLIDVNELKDLEHGRTAAKNGYGAKLPKRHNIYPNASRSTDFDAIEVVLERMLHRRFLNPMPLSVIPSALLLPGFSNVFNGNPRHMPVYAESSAQRARTRAVNASFGRETGASSANATSSEDESKREGKFTVRGQIGKPLKSQFALTDPDLFSALLILQQLESASSSRELVWAEAEEEKRSLQGVPQPPLASMATNRRFGQGHPAALKPFAHPWKSKEEFFRALDAWIFATRASADTEDMLRKYIGWEQAHDDLTVEGRKHAERRHKMSTSSVAIPSLGLNQLVLDETEDQDAVGKPNSLAALRETRNTAMGPPNGSAFAVSTTHIHEAPARLQTTRSSAPDTRAAFHSESHEADSNSKTVDSGKKKKSGRPSSSGGVGSSPTTGGPGGGAFGRARTFGRGGTGGGSAALPVPLPDAPSFMTGYAFGPSASDSIFRGPATKAAIVASSRGGANVIVPPSSRKASLSSNSLSDRSSLSVKTEKEGVKPLSIDSGVSRMAAPATGQPPAVAEEPSPAAPYAATQRVSHGLEKDFCLESDQPHSRRMSRPVSPTSGVPTAATSISKSDTSVGRPPTEGLQGGLDARSVSMPASMMTCIQAGGSTGGGGGSVRIAEPSIRPSRRRSNSTSHQKTIALIGFYDCNGFLATA